MGRFRKLMSHKQGLPPGALVHIGNELHATTDLYLFEYNKDYIDEKKIDSVDQLDSAGSSDTIYWLNVNGLADTKVIEAIGKKFDIHHLLLEDIVNTAQRPKMDDYSDKLYLTIKMVGCQKGVLQVTEEQVSMLLINNWVITFQERPGDVFEPVRERLRHKRGKSRMRDSSYLFYVLLDCIVDNYFYVLEEVEDRIDFLNNEVVVNPNKETLSSMYKLKNEINFLKCAIWPLRELAGDLMTNEAGLLNPDIMPYLTDIEDHVKQILDMVTDARESTAGLFDLYASTIGNNMNQIMKVLTIMSAVFIPMSFLAGLYGMNFANMPELQWKNGYYIALSTMAGIAVTMLAIFKKKKWW